MTDSEIVKALGRLSCKTLNDCKLINAAIDLINRLQAEVVEVVRCKDCKHCEEWNDKTIVCHKQNAFLSMKPDDFCSYGERSEAKCQEENTV